MGLNGLLLGGSVVGAGRLRGQHQRRQEDQDQANADALLQQRAMLEAWRMAMADRRTQAATDIAGKRLAAQQQMQQERLGASAEQGDLNRKNRLDAARTPRPRTPAPAGPTKPLPLAERESVAAIRNARRSAREMRTLFHAVPANATISLPAALARGAGQRMHMPEAGDAVAQMAGMTSGQIEFQRAADNLLHNLSSVLPKGGRSIALLQSLRNSFTPRAGQYDPAAAQRFVDEANRVIDTIAEEVGVPEEDGDGSASGNAAHASAAVQRYLARVRGGPPAGVEPVASATPDGQVTRRPRTKP